VRAGLESADNCGSAGLLAAVKVVATAAVQAAVALEVATGAEMVRDVTAAPSPAAAVVVTRHDGHLRAAAPPPTAA
jgi:hypothetical protein